LPGAGFGNIGEHNVGDPDDRRTRLVVLTDDGRRVLAQIAPLSATVDEQILAPLDPDDRDGFIDMLRCVAGLG
jgi:DNA-binding MarR family transcriptional regulator